MEMNYYVQILVGRKQHAVAAIGYIDTGNMLTDQKTKRTVSIASPDVIYELLPKNTHSFITDYIEHGNLFSQRNMDRLPSGMHLIPYSTISSKNDLMLAFDCDFFFINNRLIRKKPLIGISRHNFSILNTSKCILLNRDYMRKGVIHG